MTRAEKSAEAIHLRSLGYRFDEIASMFGVSRSFAHSLVSDPDRKKELARRERYRGTCVDCGAKTAGSEGRTNAPKRCSRCAHAKESAEAFWTRETIIAAIQRFASRHGRPPIATEWNHSERHDPGERYPAVSSVLKVMGWANAIEAAGFPRPARGHNPLGRKNWAHNPNHPDYLSVEELVEKLKQASKDGVAPACGDDNHRLWSAFHRRGVTWQQACDLAGVKPRGKTKPW